MDENLKIQRFEVPPSASNFEFLIESRDVPAEALWTGDLYRSGFRTMAALAIYRLYFNVPAAFKSVLDKYLGVNLNGPNPGS
ncbi:uncharacterized protein LOC111456538 isoform X5 [Cucurbita moschata]|uniref:Uncharacterized protein LOC111456538 isoform X5 n=1 Tax=Cucurbita moschata TaxID=3662 RepID=A0A6J1GQG5_CUCMO|nr:uncharacterized protein LOC111456538 isoform X5 [Cucurbita moschata]